MIAFKDNSNKRFERFEPKKCPLSLAILIPKFPLVKEWAYAGFFFAMSGAFISHLAVGQAFSEAVPSLILLIVTALSWYLRPDDRKIILAKN